jgi:hypothetical protein
LLADQSIQFQMSPFVPPAPPPWLLTLIEWLRPLGPFVGYIFWTIVIVGLLIILFLIIMELRGTQIRLPWRRKAAVDDAADDVAPDEAAARILLAEAEQLAARGDYDGAVHLLLRRSVEDIVDRMPGFVRPSLTARDIAVAPSLPDTARSAFGTIATVVESALFARVPVGAEGWRRARDAYAEFALRDAWRGSRAQA